MEAASTGSPDVPLGRYVIRERIAQGGMGEVFLAVAVGAEGFEKPVVVKRLLPKFSGQADVASMLSAEAKLMTRLIHPNIVQVIDYGRGERDDYYLVMELVRGIDLGRFIAAHRARGDTIDPPLALFILTQALRGLAHAHGVGWEEGKRLVHRDVSPSNVLLSQFGEVKIGDFGVALLAGAREGACTDGWVVGKPAYMAPEQLAGADVDERADVYAAGAVLFEMLTGVPHGAARPPALEGPSATSRPSARRATTSRASGAHDAVGAARAAEALRARVPPRLAEVVLRALEPRREDRHESARALISALEQSGVALAGPDRLAEAVSQAALALPARGQSVVVLSAGTGAPWIGTELTRGSGSSGGGFTLRMPAPRAAMGDFAAPVDAREGAASAEPSARGSVHRAATRPLARWPSALALAVLAMSSLGLLLRSRPTRDAGAAAPGPAEPASPSAFAAALPERELGGPTASAGARRDSAAADPTAGGRAESAPAAAFAAKTPPHPREAPSRDVCRGQLHVYATHGWLISGGPLPIQAPGRYDWPCGTYTLRAISRVDPRDVRTTSVAVRESAPGIFDLR